MPSPGVLWRTVRHLRPRQVAYQIARRFLPRRTPRPLPMRWKPLPARVARFKNTLRPFLAGDAFTFNNETRVAPGWNEPGARKLWLYNLHYMAWLFDLDSFEAREAWIERWIRENPRAAGGTGWEPYPVSLRLFNTAKHYAVSGRAPSPGVQASLEEQAGWLLDNLEFHLDGNHLLENLLALAYAGLFLDPVAPRAGRALRRIRELLDEALDEQYLEDGGHYELSPMYHAILLERMLDLLNVWPESGDPFPGLRERLEGLARAGLDWLDVMSVGGRFSLFNDAAYDTAPHAASLFEYGALLLGWRSKGRAPLRALPASGYYRAEAGPFTVIFDAGKLGPDRQMGHAQGDLLSFCLWLDDAPVITHPGCYEYVPGAMRDYCRSTAAHNTVVVEGAEQAEWWGSHRVGRRARPLEAGGVVEADGTIRLWGAHDGYRHLPGRPVHAREVRLTTRSLEVRDTLSGDPGKPAMARFSLQPGCEWEGGEGSSTIRCPVGTLGLETDSAWRIEEGWHCPEFGRRIACKIVTMETKKNPVMIFTFGPRNDP